MQGMESAQNAPINLKEINSGEARDHTPQIRQAFTELSQHLRKDIGKVDDAKAQALFETAAEVLDGLDRTFDHYEQRAEPAWR